MVLIVILFALAIPYSAVAQSYDYGPNDRETTSISKSIRGTHILFDREITEENVIFTEIQYIFEDQEFLLFSEIIISIENGFSIPSDQEPDIDDFKLIRPGLIVLFNDTEETEFSIQQTSNKQIDVKMILAPGVEWEAPAEDRLNLIISEEHRMTIAWSEDTILSVEKMQETVKVSFLLVDGGRVNTNLSMIPQERGENVPRISVDHHGDIRQEGPGISVTKRRAVKGEVELTISLEVPGSRIIQLNLSRELIGSDIRDLSDIRVSVNGEDIEYIGAGKLYDTDEQGYYVSIVNGETHVYLQLEESEQDVRVYDISQDHTSIAQPLSLTEMIGLSIGVIVVIAGITALLFKKKD